VNRRRVEEKHLNEEAVLEEVVTPDFQAVEDALGTLPPKLGAPLRLKYMENLSYDEISVVLGIGVSAAKMRVMRARQQLLEVLKNDEG
jgi:DNA-directed RNA polymerase specialized sigma24 family protein